MLPKVEKIDPRVSRTRQLIMNAFMDLFQEKSFQAMTVRDITEKAGINRATFYAHFMDKYELHEFVMGEMFQQYLEQGLKADAPYSQENLGQLIRLLAQFLQDMHAHCNPLDTQYKPLLEAQIQAKIHARILAWMGSDSEIQVTAMSWAIFGLALRWSKGELVYSQDMLVQKALALFESSLSQAVAS